MFSRKEVAKYFGENRIKVNMVFMKMVTEKKKKLEILVKELHSTPL